MARLLSGIQPTGDMHIGNYLGAVRNWVRLQAEYDCHYAIVDLHAMTVPYEAAEMPQRIHDTAIALLAAGIDPQRAALFVQSDVREHAELAWILMCVTPLGELARMTQFKEKSEDHKKAVSVGLYAYPVLQAADILLYRAEAVPVGEDQVQHLELTREIARRFNTRYGQVFPEPKPVLTETPRIMGLDAQAKMSKSKGNGVELLEAPERVRALLKPAATDPARKRRTDPGNPDVCNVFTMHKGFSPAATVAEVAAGCRAATIGCIECKTRLADHMTAAQAPMRERAAALRADPARVREILRDGAARCRAIAEATMRDVRRATGLSA